jgi:hypothetical protein
MPGFISDFSFAMLFFEVLLLLVYAYFAFLVFRSIQEKMHLYLQEKFLEPREGLIYVERTVGKKRGAA